MKKRNSSEKKKRPGALTATGSFLLLHVALLIYSCTGLFSKNASKYPFLSRNFILFYAGMICVLGVYALLWQQVIKRLPVTFAFANKAVTVVWGVVLGYLVFHETISPLQGVACGIIILGTVLYVRADQKEKEDVSDSPGLSDKPGL